MAHHHALKPLPWASDALEKKGFLTKEVVEWHHGTHQKGYVDKRNEIEKSLETADRAAANANYSVYGELKRRETFNASGQILHEIYWENMGGDDNIDPNSALAKKINADFGSFDDWKADFVAAAKASLGWALLCWDPSDEKLHNYLCDFHNNGAVWGAVPLVVVDVFEHAYYRQWGPKRPDYLSGFMANLNWKAINDRYMKYVPQGK